MKKLLLAAVFVFLSLLSTYATHNRAGEISYRHISNFTYEVTVVTYTYAPSLADRPELEIKWGDGTSSVIPRVNGSGNGVIVGPDIRKNIYKGIHTYSGPDVYTISIEDPNRNGGVVNIPNSVNVPFYIETVLVIHPFLGPNSSPELLNPPIDNACLNHTFIHNPGAFDIDGDSISYSLIFCRGEDGLNVPGYSYPSSSNSFSIDPISGDLVWDTPVQGGEYNFAILITEWRFGVKIGSVIRDMQVNVVPCNNNPPVVDFVPDTCVEAGTLLVFDVTANDVDMDVISLIAYGGPFMVANPAQFDQAATGVGTVTKTFSWQTNCSHVRKNPFLVLFKASDNGNPSLADIESVNITVVAPAPKNLNVTASGISMKLIWNISECSNAIGYKIYRRKGYFGFQPGFCETGVPGYTNYVEIDELYSIDDTTYTDDDNGIGLVHGIEYCYMVTAVFQDGAESYASLEACNVLDKDVPIITNVSINNTDLINGSIFVAWSKPTAFDTILAPGPYKYLIYQSEGAGNTNLILIDSLADINDTNYVDTFRNTEINTQNYKIELYNDQSGNRFLIGSTVIVPSMYLQIAPSDNKLLLSWNNNMPWTNDYFVIYKKNHTTLLFDSIGWSTDPLFTDSNLVNGNTYCYYIKSFGSYGLSGIINPIINLSQEKCGIPVDNINPCPPNLNLNVDCEFFENLLNWNNPNNSCADDVIQYNIYYKSINNNDYSFLTTIIGDNNTQYIHSNMSNLLGCYVITSIDSVMNESDFSNEACIDTDSCSLYELPNVFTPNGDGFYDLFTPKHPRYFVKEIDMQIFDRWGTVVYETKNPAIEWDGKHQKNDNECPDGTYFYVCKVYEYRLNGIGARTLSGTITILRH